MNSAVYQVYQHHRFQSLTHAVSLPADVMLEVGAEAGTHCGEAEAAHGHDGAHRPLREGRQRHPLLPLDAAGTNCIKIGLPGKLILSKRKGLWEVIFS